MKLSVFSDEHFMKLAYLEAQKAFEMDEVPVGAIITFKNKIIARAHNLTEQLTDFTAHAEMQVFTSASEHLQNKYQNTFEHSLKNHAKSIQNAVKKRSRTISRKFIKISFLERM